MNPPLTRYYPRYYRKMCYCIFQQMTWLGGNVKTKLWRLCRFMTQKHSQLNCKDFSNEANIIFAHFPDTFHHGRVSLGSVFPFFFFFWSLGRVFWVWMKAQSFGKVVRKRGQYTIIILSLYHYSSSSLQIWASCRILVPHAFLASEDKRCNISIAKKT